jgi:hypothetical protein
LKIMQPAQVPARRSVHRLLALAAAAGLSALLLGNAGCYVPGYFPGGSLASRDLYTYQSHPDYPQTITLVDTRTGEIIWTSEVPVGQQLVMRFYDESVKDKPSPENPALMRWDTMRIGKHFGELQNVMPVPGADSRRVDVTLRRAGELPPGMAQMATRPPASPLVSPAAPPPPPPPAPMPPAATTPSPATPPPQPPPTRNDQPPVDLPTAPR